MKGEKLMIYLDYLLKKVSQVFTVTKRLVLITCMPMQENVGITIGSKFSYGDENTKKCSYNVGFKFF